MTDSVYEVVTDLDPDMITAVAAETYRLWLAFALGGVEIGGKVLAHPSGRYAASLSWQRTGTASVAIIADEKVSPEAGYIEDGAPAHSMVEAMLGGGRTRTSKEGYQYRMIPIRKDGEVSTPRGIAAMDIVGNSATGERLPAGLGRMWSHRLHKNADHWAMMSNKPGASAWMVPAMPAYRPAAALAQILEQQYGAR